LVKESIQTSADSFSTEGEGKRPHPRVEEINLKCPVLDFSILSHQLIKPVFPHDTVALFIGVSAVILARRGPIDQYAKSYWFSI
jgi:hypothetical protein